jgi:hypothetical protein
LGRLTILVTLGALALAGCGTNDEDEARDHVRAWLNLIVDEEWDQVCDEEWMSRDLREGFDGPFLSCEDLAPANRSVLAGAELGEVDIDDDEARVQLVGIGHVDLVREDDDWLVANMLARTVAD